MSKLEKVGSLARDVLDRFLKTDSISEKSGIGLQIEGRTDYIIRLIWKFSGIKDSWWAWDYYEDEYSDGPEFSESNSVNGEIQFYSEREFDYVDGNGIVINGSAFPIEWLYKEDIESVVKESINKAKEIKRLEANKKAARTKELKELKKKFRKSAMSKLTDEEKWACGLSKKFPKSLKV